MLETLGADADVHAVIALILRTGATGDLLGAIAEADLNVPLAVVVLNQPEAVRLVDVKGGKAPAYAYPETAARALSRAVRYAEWRAAPRQTVPALPDVDAGAAREIVHAFLAKQPDGGWLPQPDAIALLRLYRIPLVSTVIAPTEDNAVTLAAQAGYPVALKAEVPGLTHKTDAGAVLLDLRTEAGVRSGYRRLADRFGARLAGVVVQPMITGGTEVMIGVKDDQMFGPLVVFGLGGVATEVLADHAARLAPLTEADADTLINSIRSAPLLHGHRGAPAADLAALRDVLLRVSRLTDDLPEITELDLNPVIARPDSAIAVDARIRVESAGAAGPVPPPSPLAQAAGAPTGTFVLLPEYGWRCLPNPLLPNVCGAGSDEVVRRTGPARRSPSRRKPAYVLGQRGLHDRDGKRTADGGRA